jgi:membrane protease YdiL (CAAX protease family)
MSQLTLWDHAFAFVVFVVYPVYSMLTVGRAIEDIRKRGEGARLAAYRGVILTWMFFAACLAAIWVSLDRDWADLGFRAVEAIPLAIATSISILFIAIIILPLRHVALHPQRHDGLTDQIGDFAQLMPRSRREEHWFVGVSINAGIFEELVFRGYLIWYLAHFTPYYWAAGIAVFAFVLAHGYQGWKNLPGILLVSVVVVSLFVYTGSLLIPILLHALLDIMQGHYFAIIRRSQTQTHG